MSLNHCSLKYFEIHGLKLLLKWELLLVGIWDLFFSSNATGLCAKHGRKTIKHSQSIFISSRLCSNNIVTERVKPHFSQEIWLWLCSKALRLIWLFVYFAKWWENKIAHFLENGAVQISPWKKNPQQHNRSWKDQITSDFSSRDDLFLAWDANKALDFFEISACPFKSKAVSLNNAYYQLERLELSFL